MILKKRPNLTAGVLDTPQRLKRTNFRPRPRAGSEGGFALLGKQFLPIVVVCLVLVLAVAVILFRQSAGTTDLASVKRPELTGQFGLKAVKTDVAGLDPETTFLLSSSRSLPTSMIDDLVTFTPAVEYSVRKVKETSSAGSFFSRVLAQETNQTETESAAAYELKPKKPLQADTVYTATIADTDQTDREYQWAFPVKAEFQVIESHPRHQATMVPVNSSIEFKLNREKFISPEQYFTLEPSIEGTLEQHGQKLVFLPGSLTERTVYTATLKKGLKVEGSDDVLAEDFSFSFETGETSYRDQQRFNFSTDFLEFLPDKQPFFNVWYYNFEPKDLTANLYQFDNPDQFIKAYQDSRHWEYRWTNFYWSDEDSQYEPDPNQLILTFPVNIVQVDYQKFFEVPQPLPAGYYLLDLTAAGKRHQVWLQISPVSHYFSITHDNSLLWLYDFPTRQPVPDVAVNFLDQAGFDDKLGTTNDEGQIQFQTPKPLQEELSDSPTPKFFKVSVGNQPLFIRVSDNYGYRDQAPAGDPYWDYVSLERFVYQMSDTLRFWGIVKGRQEDLRGKKVTVEATNSYYYFYEGNPWNDTQPALLTEEVTVSPFDTIEGELAFSGLTPGMYNLVVKSGTRVMASTGFEVMTYLKPAYQIYVTPSHQAIFAGEPVDFKVQAKFFDGTPAPNLTLHYYGWWESPVEGDLKLDANGEATLTYTPPYLESEYANYPRQFQINFGSKMAEEGEISGSGSLLVFGPNLSLASNQTYRGSHQYELKAKLNEIVLNQEVKSQREGEESSEYLSEYIGDPVPDYPLKARVIKTTLVQTETGEYYDPINRVVQKKYSYSPKEETVEELEGKTDANGEWTLTKEFTYEELVSYRVVFWGQDREGRKFESPEYIYTGQGYLPGKEFAVSLELNNNNGEEQYAIGDSVKAELRVTLGKLPENAKILFYRYQNKIERAVVTADLVLEEDFEQSFTPSMQYRAVVLGPTGFLETYEVTASFQETDRLLSLELKPDQTAYRPKDEVKIDLTVKDKNQQPVSAQVNVAVVDEALFHIVPYSWQPKILSTLYRNIYLWPLTGSSEYAFLEQGAEKGGCFGAGTPIQMADGSSEPIEEIAVGDVVSAGQEKGSGAIKPAVVQAVSAHLVQTYLVINQSLVVTAEHPLLANNLWQPAGNLKIGDKLLAADGTTRLVNSIETKSDRAIMVYNLVVAGYHTYFAGGILAHNAEKAGGPRTNFADVALFQTVQTNALGQGSVSFKAPDNITSWRVTALAYEPNQMLAGQEAELVPVSLPLFIDSTLNNIYRTGDEPAVRLRAFGTEYQAGQSVDFTLQSTSLNLDLKETTNESQANFDLEALPAGDHDLTIGAKQGDQQDAVKRTLSVIDNHFRIAQAKDYTVTNELKDIEGNTNAFTHLVFTEAGLGKYFWPLLSLSYADGIRSDQTAVRYAAEDLLGKYFKYPEPADQLDLSSYQVSDGGLALFSYSDSDLEITTQLADLAGDYIAQEQIVDYLTESLSDKKADLNRISQALYGLASLGEPVLAKIQTVLQEEGLTNENRAYLALGLVKLGDYEGARLVYLNQLKPALRFEGGEAWLDSETDTTRRVKLTGLFGVLAASLKTTDDAKALWDYLADHYPVTELDVLERCLMLRALLENADPTPVSFTYQTNARTETVALKNGEVYSVDLPASELKTLSFSGVSGDITLVSWYERSKNPDELPQNPDLSLTRQYLVNNQSTTKFSEGDVVLVRLDPNIATTAIDGPYQVIDYLPSGLRAITQLYNRNLSAGTECDPIWYPTVIIDQSVYFSIGHDYDQTEKCTNRTINYYARVVTPGAYSAESAVLQSLKNLESLNLSDVTSVEIK